MFGCYNLQIEIRVMDRRILGQYKTLPVHEQKLLNVRGFRYTIMFCYLKLTLARRIVVP
jgi:hypothetical protein